LISRHFPGADKQFAGAKVWYFDCSPGGMMTIVCIAFALGTAGLITELVAATHAPFGYEDEAGFHFGNAASGNAAGLENPS
jgi:hypothetical protein